MRRKDARCTNAAREQGRPNTRKATGEVQRVVDVDVDVDVVVVVVMVVVVGGVGLYEEEQDIGPLLFGRRSSCDGDDRCDRQPRASHHHIRADLERV